MQKMLPKTHKEYIVWDSLWLLIGVSMAMKEYRHLGYVLLGTWVFLALGAASLILMLCMTSGNDRDF